MAVNNSTTKITIPVEFRDTANSYKTIINDLQAQLQKIKPGTSIYNSLIKQFERVKKAAEKLELDIDLGVSKRSDIDKLENEFSTVYSLIQGIQRSFENIDLKDLNIHPENFGELATQYANARTELIRLKEEAKKAKDITVGELFKDSPDAALFNKSQMSSKGVTVFENLNQEIAQTSTNLANAQKDVKALEAALAKLQAKQATKGEPTEAGKKAQLYYGITGNASTTVKQSRENLKAAIRENFKEDGSLKAGGKAKVEEILTQFGLDPELLKRGTKERLALIEKAIDEEVNGKKFDEVRKTYSESAQTNRAAVELQQKITDTKEALDRAKHEVDTQGETGKLGELRKQVESLRQKLIDSGAIGRDGQKTDIEIQIDAVNERLEQLEQQIRANGPGGRNGGGSGPEPPSMGGVREAYDDQEEAAQFTANLKQSIAHWMSASQIISFVKDGIRQAYQDIKDLDAAMTNIAVVTDMSVSDLWGKINEYMSIAQQYGVTTQGVYEVSQLYYQQGLSTNEVMAATTETLKMARIAGMGYAEAADAMTVAIRAFKMEMSDASHVTDVYSKVAAVTASDTEELAIAMSKTASSAESVGSSFENTTAMLAVMIETTRESAQNLGSALKSIISRYGEMKQGLTQDSDGEIIDYNKTDAALRSIGISLKDAQGQFRDFDDVIFELSAKWDSLDKNTQRYIATVMAGNRQQSRFIALVDNWERLDEVAGAAQDSEDAGLLQYAKTLDSLDTKLNNLKTSFQQFYMSIFDGEFFKGFVDIITNVIDNLSKMGPILGGLNIMQLINQIKLIGQLLLNTFGKGITKIQASNKEWQSTFTKGWPTVGERIADALVKAIVAKGKEAGLEFAKQVEAGAKQSTGNVVTTGSNSQQNNVNQPQPTTEPLPLTSDEYKKRSLYWGRANRALSQFSPMTAGVQAQNGRIIEGLNVVNSQPGKDFASVKTAYEQMAETILSAKDKFSDAAILWAQKVEQAGNKFNDKVKQAAETESKQELDTAEIEYQKELAAADIEAQKEIAAAQAASAKLSTAQGLMTAGAALTSAGMSIDQSTMKGYDASTGLQAAGGVASVAAQYLTGNYVGAAVTAITTLATTIQRFTNRAAVELENAQNAANEKNVERAQAKENYVNLQTLLDQYETALKNKNNDDESYQAWLDINNQLVEAYPELLGYIDAEGNAIANVTSKTEVLSYYMQKAAEASRDYYNAKITELELQMANNRSKSYEAVAGSSTGGDITKAFPVLSSYGVNFRTNLLKSAGNDFSMYYDITCNNNKSILYSSIYL